MRKGKRKNITFVQTVAAFVAGTNKPISVVQRKNKSKNGKTAVNEGLQVKSENAFIGFEALS